MCTMGALEWVRSGPPPLPVCPAGGQRWPGAALCPWTPVGDVGSVTLAQPRPRPAEISQSAPGPCCADS